MIYYKKHLIPILTVLSGFLIIAGLAIYTYNVQKKVYLHSIDTQIKQAAEAAELYLGNDYVDRYSTKSPPSHEQYMKYLHALSKFTQENSVDYVYMMVQEKDKVYTVFSSATLYELKSNKYDDFYTLYDPSPSVLNGFKDKKPFYISESDKYGAFRSYCKYGISPDGKVYMVGADVSLRVLQTFVDDLIRFYVYVFVIMSVLIVSIFYLYFGLFTRNTHLTNIAVIDKLTQLYNRQKLDDILSEEKYKIDQSLEYSCSCMLLDIDHFKSINDEYGHLEGDRVLEELGVVMKDFFRSNDILGRWGGEEFLVLLPATKFEDANFLAEKLCRSVEAHFIHTSIPVTISIGVGFLSPKLSIRESLNEMDIALYQAKKNGRNQIQSVN